MGSLPKTVGNLLIAVVVCLFQFAAAPCSALSHDTSAALAAALKRLDAYYGDFADLAAAHIQDDMEFWIATSCCSTTRTAFAYINSAKTLLELHKVLSCSADRTKSARIIRETFRYYAKELELLANEAQKIGAHTNVPGLALSAGKLRDELRALVTVLEDTDFLAQH